VKAPTSGIRYHPISPDVEVKILASGVEVAQEDLGCAALASMLLAWINAKRKSLCVTRSVYRHSPFPVVHEQ
jgi:hypothetical protein